MKAKIRAIAKTLFKRAKLNHTPLVKFPSKKQSGHSIAYTDRRDIYVCRPMMSTSENVVKGILAHEIAHIKDFDRIEKIHSLLDKLILFFNSFAISMITYSLYLVYRYEGDSYSANLMLVSSVIASGTLFLGFLLENYFSRKFEYEADTLATKLTSKKIMMETLVFVEQKSKRFENMPTWMRTHPKHEDRVKNVLRTKI